MKKIILKFTAVVALISVTCFSCTKEVDFKQADNLVLEPVAALDLIFFDAPSSSFFVGGTELTTVRDSVIIDLFGRNFVVDNLVKAEFVFQTTNSINKAFNVQVDFFDSDDRLQHAFAVIAPASPTNTDLVNTHTEVFETNILDALKASNKIELTITALPGGSPLNDDTPGSIQLKSKGFFYFNIESAE